MKLEDIKHKAILKSVIELNIDVSPFETVKDLVKYKRSLYNSTYSSLYRKNNMKYFRDYNREYQRPIYKAKQNLEFLKELPGC